VASPPPNAETFGVITRDAEGNLRVNGELLFDDPGVVGDAAYYLRVNPSNNQSTLQTKLTARLSNPARAKTLLGVGARGTVSAEAELDLAHQRLKAKANLDLRDFAAPSMRANSLELRGTAAGALSAPELDATARAKNLALDTRRFARARVTAKGTPQRLRVDALLERDESSRLHLNTLVALAAATELLGLQLSVTTKDGTVDARIASIELRSGAARISGFELSGAGSIRGNGTVASNRADLEFAMQDLDLAGSTECSSSVDPCSVDSSPGREKSKARSANCGASSKRTPRDLDFESVRGGQVDLALAVGDSVISGTVDAKLGRSQFAGEIPRTTHSDSARDAGRLAQDTRHPDFERQSRARSIGARLARGRGPARTSPRRNADRSESGEPGRQSERTQRGAATKDAWTETGRAAPRADNIETASTARETQPASIEGLDTEFELSVDNRAREARLEGSLFDRQGALARLAAETKLANLSSAGSRGGVR
jgi:hypothetical protein